MRGRSTSSLQGWRLRTGSVQGCAHDLHLSTNADLARQGVDVNDEIVCYVCAAKDEYTAQMQESHKDDPEFWYGRAIVAQLLTTETPTDDSEAVT